MFLKLVFSSPSYLLGGLILSSSQIPGGGYGRMHFNLLGEFYWILGGLSMIGFNSEENKNVRETQIPCPAVVSCTCATPVPPQDGAPLKCDLESSVGF